MTPSLNPLLLLVFLLPFAAAAQPEFRDTVGTIHVKKKKDHPGKLTDASGQVFIIAEEMPQFPITGMSIQEFIRINFVVPQEAFEKGISGAVIVEFLVETDGKLTGIKVKKSVPGCSSCDAEAIRVVKLMPPWIPGTQNGKPVPVLLSIPVKFRFNGG